MTDETLVEPARSPIVVPAELRDPHKLVSEASRLLRGRKPYQGLVHCRGARCLDIAVAPASLGRALRIMNALVRALEKRGLEVEVTRPLTYEEERRRAENEAPGNATVVTVSGEWVQLGLTEKRSIVPSSAIESPKGMRGTELEAWISRNGPRTELVPNGLLELSIKNGSYLGVRTTWHDGKRKRLEDRLDDFVAHLPIMADAIRRQREETLCRERERQEAEHRRWEEEQRRREEAKRIEQFEEELRCWRLARDAREYVAEVREILAATERDVSGESELEKSLKWAEAYAGRIDPVARIREEVARDPTENDEVEKPEGGKD